MQQIKSQQDILNITFLKAKKNIDIKQLLIITVILFIIGYIVYQTLLINKLKKELNNKHDKLYNQFILNKSQLMDSVRVNNNEINQIYKDINKLKQTIHSQKPIYYQMNNQQMEQYMSYLIGKYKDE